MEKKRKKSTYGGSILEADYFSEFFAAAERWKGNGEEREGVNRPL